MSNHLDIRALCRKIGGTKPVDPSTVYRKIQSGELPKPLKLGRVSRWREDEIDAVLQRLAEARGGDHTFEK